MLANKACNGPEVKPNAWAVAVMVCESQQFVNTPSFSVTTQKHEKGNNPSSNTILNSYICIWSCLATLTTGCYAVLLHTDGDSIDSQSIIIYVTIYVIMCYYTWVHQQALSSKRKRKI